MLAKACVNLAVNRSVGWRKYTKFWLYDCNPSIFISCSYWTSLELQELYQIHMHTHVHVFPKAVQVFSWIGLLSGKFSVLRMNRFTNGAWAVSSFLAVSASRQILCSYTELQKFVKLFGHEFWAVVWLLLSSAMSSEVVPQRLPVHLDTTVLSEPRC
jgi:hypothetical protein